jgi:MoxR-like ATPase
MLMYIVVDVSCGFVSYRKTMLLRFLCAWLDVPLMCLDVHGGTTEEDILNIFADAADALSKPLAGTRRESSVYVFLDEINTCSHMVQRIIR